MPEAAKVELPPKPIEEVRPVVAKSGFWAQIVALFTT